MTQRKNAKSRPAAFDPDLVEELFDNSDGDNLDYFDFLSSPAVGRLIASCALLGGMVSFYRDAADNTLGISIRFGEHRKSFSFDGSSGDDIVLEQITNRYHNAYAKRQRTEPTKLPIHKPIDP